MVNVAKAVRVVRSGRTWRDVVEDDRSAMRRQPFSQSWDGQRPSRDSFLVRQKIRPAHVMRDQDAILH
jgi:hypothetical protein